MTKPAVFEWPAQDTAAIAALQTAGAGASLILNGTLKQATNPVVTLLGISRKLTLTSAANLSGGNFVITGTYLGKPQTETLAGPNANTVETTELFNTIESVVSVASTGVNTVSVGTGSDGHTNPYLVDPYSTVFAVSAQVYAHTGTGLTYTFKSTIIGPEHPIFDILLGQNTMYNMVGVTDVVTIGAHGTLPILGTGNTPP